MIFIKAQPFATLLIFLSFPNVIGYFDINIGENSVAVWGILYQLFGTLIDLFMMYYILEGTFRFARNNEYNEWANSAKSIWNYYAVIQLMILSIHAFLLNITSDFIQVILIISVILALIIEIVVIVFMKRCKNNCEEMVTK